MPASVVQSVELEEHRGRRGRRVWRPRVVIEYRYGGRTGYADHLYFGGAKKFPRAEAEAVVEPYQVGDPARVWLDPDDPTDAIIERRFDDGNRVWTPMLPLVAAGWLGFACVFWPPNQPRDLGNGTLEWSTRRVRIARLLVDGVIGFSVAGGYVWFGVSRGGWTGAACAAAGLLVLGGWMLSIGVSSIMRILYPRISATVISVGEGWRVDYEISGGLVRPRRVAVTALSERRWTIGSGKKREEHHATPYVQTLASHEELPAAGEIEIFLPEVNPERRRERVRHFVIFRGGRPWWPDFHETFRLPERSYADRHPHRNDKGSRGGRENGFSRWAGGR